MHKTRGKIRLMRGLTGRRARTLALALLVGATAVAVSTAAVAPAKSPGVIRACVSKRTGVIRASNRCRKGERRLQWNVRGPQGPVGPTGATGSPGPKGDPGAQGPKADPEAIGAARKDGVSAELANGQPNTAVSSNASCGAGKTLLGGGFQVTGDVKKAIVTASMPSTTLANTWTAAAVAISSNADITITAYAICA